MLVLLAGTAGAGIVAAHLLLDPDGSVALGLTAVGHHIRPGSTHITHVGTAALGLTYISGSILPHRDVSPEQELHHLAADTLDDTLEEVEALELVDKQRVLLLVCGILHGLLEVVHIAQVLLPGLVYHDEGDGLADGPDKLAALRGPESRRPS